MKTSEKATWRDPALGKPREVDLPAGKLRYFEAGTGAPIVFVHGLLVNANLWRKVVARLAPDFRCIALDLPLGSHELPMNPDADLAPPAVASLIADALEALGLEDVTLVGNDTGGAICQMVVTSRPERVGRLVLTSCDYRDNFPPKLFSYFRLLPPLAPVLPVLFGPMRFRAPRRLPIAFGWLTKRRIDREAEDSYILPVLVNKGARRDAMKVIRGADSSDAHAAADRLGKFGKPALIAWSAEDKVFPKSDAEGLAADLGSARVEWVEDARTFASEDNPDRLAELIAGFVREPVASTA
jgi:pimeloyl-ACP methyl ester carboxylesterase